MSGKDLKTKIRTEAVRLGFVSFGVASASSALPIEAYTAWVSAGKHAEMRYLARPDAIEKRKNPGRLLPAARSVLCFAYPYPLNANAAADKPMVPNGRIASFARFEDYHQVLKHKLQSLCEFIRSLEPNAECTIAVDAEPLLEKALAHAAGIGWIGQNTLLFNREHGSHFVLGEILTALELPADEAMAGDPCLNCGRCLNACPTQALDGNRGLDARRCLSYQTIENRESIPLELRPAIGNRIFGCDTCQFICPYNSTASPGPLQVPRLPAHIALEEAFQLDEKEFKNLFSGTPVLRAKWLGFHRNAIIAIGNSRHAAFVPLLKQALASEQNPILIEAIEWAVSRLQGSSVLLP